MYSSEEYIAAPSVSSTQDMNTIAPEKRWRMIAEAAYFYAEKRGFVSGNELQDWLQAEVDIDRSLYSPRETQETQENPPPVVPEALSSKEIFEQKREAQLKKWDATANELRAKAQKKANR